jgi:hypothetical protein
MLKYGLLAAMASLTLMFVSPPKVRADPGQLEDEAKAKLETLKKRFPGIVAAWHEEHGEKDYKAKVAVFRRTGPTEAKATIRMEYTGPWNDRCPWCDNFVSIYLRYCDGAWTTTNFTATWNLQPEYRNRTVHFLLLAIDELGDK